MKTCPKCKQKFDDSLEFCPNDGLKLRRASKKKDALVGAVLDGRYLIQDKIGEGGMGSVYKGHQQNIDRPVAIKTLRKTLIDSEEFIDRFFREAQIASKINHPNCVTIYDYGHAENDVLYIAMEFLDGEPLSDIADRGDLSLIEILEIACDTARALAAAHTFNVVHRDLKPDNIFVVDVPGGGKNAKVLDFGIAKALDAEKSMTRTGMIFGTPEYMSPEQCAGTDIDGRSDLYSLGCILYELVGGRTPFRATTPMAVLMAHVNEAVPQLDDTKAIPPSLDAIIFKLLTKDPDGRFANANDLLEALEHELKVLQGLTSGANPMMPARNKNTSAVAFDSTVAMDGSGPLTKPTVQTENPSRGKLVILSVAIIALLGIGGTITAVLMGQDATDSVDATSATTSADGAAEASTIEILEAPEDETDTDESETVEQDTPSSEVAAANTVEEKVREPAEEEDDTGSQEAPAATDTKPAATEKKTIEKTTKKTIENTTKKSPEDDPKDTQPAEEKAADTKKGGTDREYESEMDKMFEL